MDQINFIDPTISSDFESRDFGNASESKTQEVRRSPDFKGMLRKYINDSNPKSNFTKKKDRYDVREPARKLTSLLEDKPLFGIQDFQSKKCQQDSDQTILKYGSYNHAAFTLTAAIIKLDRKVVFSSEMNIKINRPLLKESKIRPILKNRNKSLPNIRMFESMKSSWYPQPSQGDCPLGGPSSFKSQLKSVKLAVDDRKLTVSHSSKKLLNLNPGFANIGLPTYVTKNSASVRLTVKLSNSRSKISSELDQQSSGPLQRIDTIIDAEELLMANEDFVRYLAERHKHVTGYRKQTCQPKSSKKTIVKLAFGNTLKGT
jgi:hypothetical protein